MITFSFVDVLHCLYAQEEKYQMLCEEMVASETETKWTVEGPPNRK